MHVQGSPDFTEQVEEQLDNLHKDFKQKVASNGYGKQTRKNKTKKDQEKLETGIRSQNIWSNESPTKVRDLSFIKSRGGGGIYGGHFKNIFL